MAKTRQERQQEARAFLRTYGAWVRNEFGPIADLPETTALVEEPIEFLLEHLARWIERGVSANAVELARQQVSAAYREARKAATSRRGPRKLRKPRRIRTPGGGGEG